MFNRNLAFSVVDHLFICVKTIWDIWEYTLLLECLLYIHVLYFKNSYETAKNSDRYRLISRIIETREKGH